VSWRTRQIGIRFIPEPVAYRIGRFACKVLGWHGISCRGRKDHTPDQMVSHPALERWYL